MKPFFCCAAIPALLACQATWATALVECPGVRYVYTSSVSFQDPANAGLTCRTAYDGGSVASDGSFSSATGISSGWSLAGNVAGQILRLTNSFGITWNLGPLPGRLSAVVDSSGNVTQYSYDAQGRVETTTAPGSQVTQYAYDSLSNRVETTTAPGGNVTTYTYDAGRPQTVTETSGGGHSITYTYDSLSSRPSSAVESPGGRSLTYTYDAGNRLIERTDTAAPTVTYTYDGLTNRVTQIEDATGNRVTYTYDASFNIKEAKEEQPPHPDPTPVITTYQYDATGLVTDVTHPSGFITRFEYDGLNRLVRDHEAFGTPQERITRFEYDAQGRLSFLVDPQDLRIDFNYVPAPGTLLLFGLALGGMATRRRRK